MGWRDRDERDESDLRRTRGKGYEQARST